MIIQKVSVNGDEVVFEAEEVTIEDRSAWAYTRQKCTRIEPDEFFSSIYVYTDDLKLVMSTTPDKWSGCWVSYLDRGMEF